MSGRPFTSRSKEIALLVPIVRGAIAASGLTGADAEDACQVALAALGRDVVRLGTMTEAERRAYAWVVATREAARTLTRRRVAATPPPSDPDATDPPAPSAERPDRVLSTNELKQHVVRGVGELPTPQRAAVQVVARGGLTNAEAAAELGIPKPTLASRLRKAREVLRRKMNF